MLGIEKHSENLVSAIGLRHIWKLELIGLGSDLNLKDEHEVKGQASVDNQDSSLNN